MEAFQAAATPDKVRFKDMKNVAKKTPLIELKETIPEKTEQKLQESCDYYPVEDLRKSKTS